MLQPPGTQPCVLMVLWHPDLTLPVLCGVTVPVLEAKHCCSVPAHAGCLPGYGTTTDNPNECRECPAGTFSLGGSLQPCTKCPDGFDSVPGAPSARFCVCKAGYGAADGTCTACAKGYYNPGVLVQKIAGKDGVAPATNITLQKQGLMSPGLRALVLAVQEAQDSGTAPTNNKCTFCGAGFTTTSTGATSSRACGK